jgi:hypothetical protein
MRFRVLLITQYLIQEILVKTVLDVYIKGVQNKKFLKLNVITMHFLYKWFMKKYLCWFIYGESCVPHKTIIERLLMLVYIWRIMINF